MARLTDEQRRQNRQRKVLTARALAVESYLATATPEERGAIETIVKKFRSEKEKIPQTKVDRKRVER